MTLRALESSNFERTSPGMATLVSKISADREADRVPEIFREFRRNGGEFQMIAEDGVF